jgi:hypothetical protein
MTLDLSSLKRGMLITKPLVIRTDHAEIIHKILKDNLEVG